MFGEELLALSPCLWVRVQLFDPFIPRVVFRYWSPGTKFLYISLERELMARFSIKQKRAFNISLALSNCSYLEAYLLYCPSLRDTDGRRGSTRRRLQYQNIIHHDRLEDLAPVRRLHWMNFQKESWRNPRRLIVLPRMPLGKNVAGEEWRRGRMILGLPDSKFVK